MLEAWKIFVKSCKNNILFNLDFIRILEGSKFLEKDKVQLYIKP